MTEDSLTNITQPTSTNSTPEVKKTYALSKKVKSSLLFQQGINQESISVSIFSYVPKKIRVFFPGEQLDAQIDISQTQTIEGAIKSALEIFSRYKAIDLDPLHYDVYVAKKNGQPKMDYPSFQNSQIVTQTRNESFSIMHVTDFGIPNKLQKIQSLNAVPRIEQISKRKNTNISEPEKVDRYSNALSDLDQIRNRKKTQSAEIEQPLPIQKKQYKYWILGYFGCA